MSEIDVRSSFVSIVDHLPCEITRKLWLIQSLNKEYDTLKNKLNGKLKELQTIQTENITKFEYLQKIELINSLSYNLHRIRSESLQESNSILISIKIAKNQVELQSQQLNHELKMYQNELELKINKDKHHQRSNTKVTNNPKKLTLKIKLPLQQPTSNDKTGENNVNLMTDESPRKRGRPKLSSTNIISKQDKNIKVEKKLIIKKLKTKVSNQQSNLNSKIPKKQVNSNKHNNGQILIDQNTKQEQEQEKEPLYCICKRPSEGDMVACDNPKCKMEWFHYECVGLKRPPRGEWFCPKCIKKLEKKKKL
ncbi:hypothetical protein WICMUC_004643 [Wickerhamomyces mucosus]|uniref:PHD-type domain-containing protein n=1 Tax=Wickerhamomyces mucosus TaxID=1378264 RepID=A0A9P8TAB1_9ASCO|nr:hypothetical protein WICMUC_004643 [Wickerhamomyces mucosus]